MEPELPKNPEIEIASSARIDQFHPDLIDEFIERALDLEPDGVFLLTDESSLWDFEDEGRTTEDMVKKIYVEFDVDVSDMKVHRIAEILDRIEKRRLSWDRGDPEC